MYNDLYPHCALKLSLWKSTCDASALQILKFNSIQNLYWDDSIQRSFSPDKQELELFSLTTQQQHAIDFLNTRLLYRSLTTKFYSKSHLCNFSVVFEILHKDGGMGDTDLYITSCLANINQTVIWCYTTQEQWLDETDTQVQQYKPDSTVSFKTAQESVDKTWYFFNLSTLPSRSIASKGTNSCQCDIYLNHLVLAKEASLSHVKLLYLLYL